jgi:tRNA nucleotidyltransferase (CCA-adding enzyme)
MAKTEIYLVGGAVRDALLNKPIRERDWVVVGATPDDLLKQGYKAVGKDFPVFLHPKTHEEYALARTERKVAPGYQGFQFYAAPDVTLEQDLSRRDLTINAIAKSEDGTLIDPFHGVDDLKQKQLRHVSDAFSEDPVRLLRIARFACYLPGFTIHPETMQLLKAMVENKEVDALVTERVWAECVKAMVNTDITPFFQTLEQCGALPIIFKGLTLSDFNFVAYTRYAKQYDDIEGRWAALCSTLSLETTAQLNTLLRIPKKWQALTLLVQTGLPLYHNFTMLSPAQILTWLTQADAFRRSERFLHALNIITLCADDPINQTTLLALLDKLNAVSVQALIAEGIQGEAIAETLKEKRLVIITNAIQPYRS